MQTNWRDALLSLNKGQLLRIRGGQGASVIVFGGRVWLTQDGDERDIHLCAGESFTLDTGTPALLQALAPAKVLLAEPLTRRRAQGRSEGLWARLRELVARAAGRRRLRVEHRPAAA
jgi:hypothetical protein